MTPEKKPEAIIADIDGTLALMGDRGPFEWDKVHNDKPNRPVMDTVTNIKWGRSLQVIFVSGRKEICRKGTITWLAHYGFDPKHLYMRPNDDNREDSILKKEIYEQRIQPHFDVFLVLDDRDKVVKMWRSLGLTCFQVAEGNF